MRIYTRIVIDIASEEVEEVWSEEWDGPVAECKGGGGSTSGTVDYPDYMKTQHEEWMDDIDSAISTATNPWTNVTAYSTITTRANIATALGLYETDASAINPLTMWPAYVSASKTAVDGVTLTDADIAVVSAAHGAMLDDRLTTTVLPRFQTGMRDINAVISSSFTTGQAILEAFNTREVADLDAKLRLTRTDKEQQQILQGASDMVQLQKLDIDARSGYTQAVIEGNRIGAVLGKEEVSEQGEFDFKSQSWNLDKYQHGANMLGAIAGSAVSTAKAPSNLQSALGGAMSGAAAGAMIGGTPGAAIGGVLGGLGGLLT